MKGKSEALVGIVIIAGLTLTVVGTLWLQGYTWGGEFREMSAVFEEVGQIKSGSSVKFRGVQVGRVRDLEMVDGGRLVRVSFRIPVGLTLPDDAVMILSPESLFGDWQAEIQSRDRFPHARYTSPDDPEVLAGYALPDISQLTAAADRISENLAVLTDRVGIAFSEETARNVASLIENVEEVTERLSELVSQQAASFTDVTVEVQEATREVGSAAAGARDLFARLDQVVGRDEIGQTLEDLAVITENLKGLSGEMGQTNVEVRQMAMRVDSTFARLDRVAAVLEAGEGSIGRLLADPQMAAEVEGTLLELRVLLEDIRENPRRYLRLSIF